VVEPDLQGKMMAVFVWEKKVLGILLKYKVRLFLIHKSNDIVLLKWLLLCNV